jgi:hypothetical protein
MPQIDWVKLITLIIALGGTIALAFCGKFPVEVAASILSATVGYAIGNGQRMITNRAK